MTETISLTIDSEDVKTFEEQTGLKFVDGVKLLMDNLKYGGKLGLDPFWSEENQMVLSKAIEDAKNGRNMHEHELIEVDITATNKKSPSARVGGFFNLN